MSTYREIIGKKIKKVSSDPSSGLDGEMWYNSTTGTLRGLALLEAWASGANMIESRQNVEGAGTQTAGLAINGATGPGTPTFLGNSSEYNGLGWATPVSTNVSAISKATFGTQTAAVAAGGYNTSSATADTVEEYNGTAWTAVTAMPQATRSAMGMGAENSGLVAGGEAATVLTNTQEYNGSSWTAGGAIPAATYNAGAGGTSESNSWFAGGADSFKNTSFLYNGSAWTASGNINTARDQLGGAGISTAALIFGGRTPPGPAVSTATENFDGSSWTTSPATLGTAAKQSAAFGTKTAAVYAGNDPAAAITQEFNSSTTAFTTAAWASAPSINTGRRGMQNTGIGSATAGLIVGGVTGPGPTVNKTEEYDGSSWTETGNYPTNLQNAQGSGIQTAAYVFGGSDGSSNLSAGNTYDGSSWTGGTALPTATWIGCGAGTAPTAILAGGATPGSPTPSISTTLEYASSSWTAGGSLSTARRYHGGFGTQTSMTVYGGKTTPGPLLNSTEEYNGTAWTGGGNFVAPTFLSNSPASPSGDVGMAINGRINSPTATTATALYDGTTWVTDVNTSTANDEIGAIGTSTTAIKAGGNPGGTTASEEYTAATSSANIENFTTS